MLVTKTAKTVTNISKLSPTHFVSNIRHQHRWSRNAASIHLMFHLLNWNSSEIHLPIRSAQRNHLMHFASIVNQFAHTNIINGYNFVFSVYWWWFKSVLSWTRVSVKIWSFCKCCWSHWKIYLIVKRRISFWQLLLTMYCWHVWNSAVTILKKISQVQSERL